MHRLIAILVSLAGVIACGLPVPADSAQDIMLSLTVNGQHRIAYVHVPARLDPGAKYPLVIGYHGGGGNAAGYIRQSRIFTKGEEAGFIMVCPEGTSLPVSRDHRIWNSGPEYARAARGADDVAFTVALIDEVSTRYAIDPKRVYATGFSNGGQMSYRLALELSDKIAAIAVMSGGRLAEDRRPGRAVPVLHVHGTADGVYPLEGGLGPYSIGRTPHVSILAVIAEWCTLNGARLIPQIGRHDGWERRTHDGPAPVELVLVKGMGHQIAGGDDDHLPRQAMRDQPDAVGMAIAFFAAHPMP